MIKNFIFRIVVMVVIMLMVSTIYIFRDDFNQGAEKAPEDVKKPKISEQSQGVVLIPDAKLIFQTYYEECGHLVTEEKPLRENFIGMNKSTIQREYPDWTVITFQEDKVVLKKIQEGLCPEHYFIGIKDGYVALFKGKPGYPDAELIEKTDVSVNSLRETDRLMLEKGIEVYGKDQLKKVREGFSN